jgi:DNA-binding IclR family transcriptional regulator
MSGMSSAVAKSFQVLEALSARGPVRLSTLATELEMGKSTVHRVLGELIELGYVDQEPDSGRYRPTLRTWELGTSVVADLPVKQIAGPAIQELHASTGETVSLVVRSGDDALYLDKLVAPRPMRFTTRIGSRVPLPLPAGGKALLAFAADRDDVVRRVAARPELATILDVDAVLRELASARRRGYAIASSRARGVTSLAAAVLDRDERPAAALAVSAPSERLTKNRRDEVAGAVVSTATRLSESLGRL